LSLLLVIEKSGERVEPLVPELVVVVEPHGRFLHRAGRQRAIDHPALLLAPDEPGFLENSQVLHESGQGHRKWLRKLGDGPAAEGEQFDDLAARRVGERREDGVERLLRILNHKV